jgi:IS1 family transposase
MNRLSRAERAKIIGCLTEGMSIRATSRLTGAAQNTIMKLLRDLGSAAADYQDRTLRNLACERIQADEIWAFVGMKAKNVPEDKRGTLGYGDVWTWTALDPDSKLLVSWLVGERTMDAAMLFMADVASRLGTRPQITTDGNMAYRDAIEAAFGSEADYAQLLKQYGVMPSDDGSMTARRYSPNVVTSVETRVIAGNPDPDHISTSHVERSNLTIRMQNRRFTRLTNAFSKRIDNHAWSVALFMLHYNFARPHRSLGKNVTPAMAAGIADHVWTLEEIAGLLDSN